jgi:ATP-dependent 26S proteasome regulatory subunit
VELWLEMKLPDPGARARILERHTTTLPADLQDIDRIKIVELTDGFTGADVKRLVEDAKGLYAFDRARSIGPAPATEYFAAAAGCVRENKLQYQQAEEAARSRPKNGFHLPGFFYSPPPAEED